MLIENTNAVIYGVRRAGTRDGRGDGPDAGEPGLLPRAHVVTAGRLRARYLPAPVAPIVVGVGEASKGQLAHRAALALAERLGKEPTVFPGGHSGIGSQTETFAGRLHEVFSNH